MLIITAISNESANELTYLEIYVKSSQCFTDKSLLL